MAVSDLSQRSQDYLKAIWSVAEWTDEPVTTTALVERLGLRASTVSDGVRRLADAGLVDHAKYGSVALTDAGRDAAVQMVRRHRLLETFLVETLGYGWDEVHDEAERLEHAVSDLLVERVDALLGRPTRDPHGDPIPSAAGDTHRPEAAVLAEAAPGSRVVVVRISDADPALLQRFAECGIVVDAELEVSDGGPLAGGLAVAAAGRAPVQLGPAALAAVMVARPAR